jgi:hypothetical protein
MKYLLIVLLIILISGCNDKVETAIFEGGAAISVCTEYKKSCPVTKDARSSDWGYFADMTTCNSRVKDLQAYGLNTGDPVCVPCKTIKYDSRFKSFSCDWVD